MAAKHVRGFSLMVVGLILMFLGVGRCVAQIAGTDVTGGPYANVPWIHPGLVISSTWAAAPRGGEGAGGISQSVVTAVGEKLAIVVTSSYANMQLLGVRDPQLQDTPKTYAVPLDQNELWIDPTKLAQLKTDNDDHTVVAAVRWKVGDQTTDAIRIVHLKNDHYLEHVFEKKSGLCLHSAESTGAPPLEGFGEGDGLITGFTFVSMRDVHTPWAKEAMPAWTGQFKALHYRGESRQPLPTQLAMDVTRRDIGKDWISVDSNISALFQGQMHPVAQSIYLCGCDQYSSYFAGPASLAKLQAGQVLDTDPLTHVQTVVTQTDDRGVTIRSSSAGTDISRTYDPHTGKMIGFSRTDMLTKFRTTFQLQSEE